MCFLRILTYCIKKVGGNVQIWRNFLQVFTFKKGVDVLHGRRKQFCCSGHLTHMTTQICWTLPHINTWHQLKCLISILYSLFHHLRFHWHTFNYIMLLCPLLLQWYNGFLTGKLWPPTAYLYEPTPNNCIKVWKGMERTKLLFLLWDVNTANVIKVYLSFLF